MRTCLFPGTFDPITLGHVDIVMRAAGLFDRLIIGVGTNASKTPMFSDEQRVAWMEEIFSSNPTIEAKRYSGLTVEACKALGAQYILRGIRFVADFEYEKAIADMNAMLVPGIETIFLTSSPRFGSVSSTIVRDVIRNGGDVSRFVPEAVLRSL